MEQERAFNLLSERYGQICPLEDLQLTDSRFVKWQRDTRVDLEHIFGTASPRVSEFKQITFSGFTDLVDRDDASYRRGLLIAKATLLSFLAEIKRHGLGSANVANAPVAIGAVKSVVKLCADIHRFAVQLQSRRANRPTVAFSDEYDAQDALHALLRLHFDDVRPEEPTPSLAGKSARMDFLLKQEKIVVEAKMPRDKAHAKKNGEELILDIAHYEKHADCKTLVCLVYDPNSFIQNPAGLAELNSTSGKIRVEVVVTTKGT